MSLTREKAAWSAANTIELRKKFDQSCGSSGETYLEVRKILASDMTVTGNSVTLHCSDPPNKHQGHVQDVQGDFPVRPIRPDSVSGVGKSRQAVLEKIPCPLGEDVAA